MTLLAKLPVAFFTLILIFLSTTSFIPSDPTPKSALTQNQTLDRYKQLYNPEPKQFSWNGSIKNCEPGTLPNYIYKTAEKRVNFFRSVNGLPPIKIDEMLNPSAQEAALIMASNNQLSHFPSSDWTCYTRLGAHGAKSSNLTLGNFDKLEPNSLVTGFIWDYGSPNYYVGHRRWLLYSRLKNIGYGLNHKAEVINVADGITPDEVNNLPEFIAYPWNGFVPVDLIFPKWSFSIPQGKEVDFSKAQISMTDWKGHRIKILKFAEKKMLDPTICWEAVGLFTPHEIKYGLNKLPEKGFVGKFIQVKITNVLVDGIVKSYQYKVEVIDPE